MNKYGISIFWNEAEGAFISDMPELNGCIARGETAEDALRQVKAAAQQGLLIASDMGWGIREPKGKLLFA